LPLFAQSHRDVFADGERIEEGGELEDVADAGAQGVEISARELGDVESIDDDVPFIGSSRPTMCLIATDFPVPEKPMMTIVSPSGTTREKPSSTFLGPKDL
jgi:hypothetical protein